MCVSFLLILLDHRGSPADAQTRADYDMLFADDEENKSAASLKFLQLAAEWKKKQAMAEQQAAAAAPEPVAVQEEHAEEHEGEEMEAVQPQQEGQDAAAEDGASGDEE